MDFDNIKDLGGDELGNVYFAFRSHVGFCHYEMFVQTIICVVVVVDDDDDNVLLLAVVFILAANAAIVVVVIVAANAAIVVVALLLLKMQKVQIYFPPPNPADNDDLYTALYIPPVGVDCSGATCHGQLKWKGREDSLSFDGSSLVAGSVTASTSSAGLCLVVRQSDTSVVQVSKSYLMSYS